MILSEEHKIHTILRDQITELFYIIASCSETDEYGTYWRNSEGTIREDVYAGVSGIVIFIQEYFLLTDDKRALSIIKKANKWLIHHYRSTKNTKGSFLTGRTGILFAIERSARILGKSDGYEISELLNGIEISETSSCDLLNGLSGNILGLLHLYDLTKNKYIKKKLEVNLDKLLHNIKVAKNGIVWDIQHVNVQPLCGIAHGNSGIALSLIEVGKYFRNELLLQLAKSAIDYESSKFDTASGCWPDFRIAERINSFNPIKIHDVQNFEPRFLNVWCNGSAGIGLTRIRASEIIRINSIQKDIINAGRSILAHPRNSKLPFCLCHGSLGNASFFLELYKRTRNSSYLRLYYSACTNVIYDPRYSLLKRTAGQRDMSLFLGLSGIAMAFIQAITPFTSFSPLLPTIQSTSNEKITTSSPHKLIKNVWRELHPLTSSLITSSLISNNKLSSVGIDPLKGIKLNEKTNFLLAIESKRRLLNNQIENYGKMHAIYNFRSHEIEKIISEKNWHAEIVVSPAIRFYQKKTIKAQFVLYPERLEYKIIRIGNRDFNFIKKFKKPIAINQFLAFYDDRQLPLLLKYFKLQILIPKSTLV